MITQSATSGIEWLFEKAVRENSISGPEDHCSLSKITAGKDNLAASGSQHLVVLTISSYLFRIVALFQFKDEPDTRAHMARMTRSQTPDLEPQALSDAYSELVNMVCGAVNRGLGQPFPHIGMSTPFTLESSCANYVAALEPKYLQRYEVAVNGSAIFNLTLCLCAANDTSLDFRIDTYEPESESSGELELF